MTMEAETTRGALHEKVEGREMDARVAEAVFGWTECDPFEVYDDGIGRAVGWGRNRGAGRHEIPFFSTDLADAWAVVEKIAAPLNDSAAAIGLATAVITRYPDGSWRARIGTKGRSGSAVADTAPLAICRAALEAISPTSDKRSKDV